MVKLDDFTLSLILNKLDICQGNTKYKIVCKKWFYLLKNKKNKNCQGLFFMGYKLCFYHNKELVDKVMKNIN